MKYITESHDDKHVPKSNLVPKCIKVQPNKKFIKLLPLLPEAPILSAARMIYINKQTFSRNISFVLRLFQNLETHQKHEI